MLKADFLSHWRITGTPEFIDSVISRLKDLLAFENGNTRLQVVYKESTDRKTGARLDSWNCYIQVHERGGEAKIANAIFGLAGSRRPAGCADLFETGGAA